MKDFLKKYWWAIALVVLAIAAYIYYMKSAPPVKTNPTCPTSVADWEAKVAKVVLDIKNDAGWLAYAKSNKPESISLDEHLKGHATAHLVSNMGECNPLAKPA